MTPLIKTTAETRTETVKSVRQREHIRMVSVDELQQGDIVVEPSRTQLAHFPDEEFMADGADGRALHQLLFQRGVIAKDPEGAFQDMEWKSAVALVADLAATLRDSTDDAEIEATEEKLGELFSAEVERTPPRKSVIKAFKAAGLGDAQDFKV